MSGKVTMLESSARGFANAVKRLAVKDKKFAEELVYMHGIRSEITPKALKGITKDMFDKGGKLSEKGRNEITRLIEEYKLPQNATWDDALAALKASKEKLAAQIKVKPIQMPKIVHKVAAKLPKLEIPTKADLAKYLGK